MDGVLLPVGERTHKGEREWRDGKRKGQGVHCPCLVSQPLFIVCVLFVFVFVVVAAPKPLLSRLLFRSVRRGLIIFVLVSPVFARLFMLLVRFFLLALESSCYFPRFFVATFSRSHAFSRFSSAAGYINQNTAQYILVKDFRSQFCLEIMLVCYGHKTFNILEIPESGFKKAERKASSFFFPP